MKINVICQTCGKLLASAEKDQVSQSDLDMYVAGSSCATDGPFPAVMGIDEEGSPIEIEPAVANTILAVKLE